MAAIARKLLFAALLFATAATADQAHDILQAINHVATALTDGNPADAMAPFDKSCPKYATLQNNFIGLTDAYQVNNEASVTDEQDAPTETKLTLQWTLNLTNKSTNETINRDAEVHVRLRSENGRWKIIEFSPVDLFNLAASSSRQSNRGLQSLTAGRTEMLEAVLRDPFQALGYPKPLSRTPTGFTKFNVAFSVEATPLTALYFTYELNAAAR